MAWSLEKKSEHHKQNKREEEITMIDLSRIASS